MKRRMFFGLISSLVFFGLMFAAAVCPVFAAYVGDGFCGHMASDIDYKYINKFHCQCYHCGTYRNHKYDTFGFNLLGLDPAKVHRCIYCRIVGNHTFGNLSSSARCTVHDAGENCTHRVYSINGGAYDANNHICRYCGYTAPHSFGDPNMPVREIKCTCGYVCPHSFNAFNADGNTHTCSICHFKFIHNFVPKADGSRCVCSDCGYTLQHSFADQDGGTHKCSVCGYIKAHEWNFIISDQFKHTCSDCGRQDHHTFVNGVCSVCGYYCRHTFNIMTGICMNCGYNMYDPNNNSTCSLKESHSCAQACPECGLRLPHDFEDQGDGTHECSGVSGCGLTEEHNYAVVFGFFSELGNSLQHECSDCGRKENHHYVDNICDVCGITDIPTITSTTPGDGAGNVPVDTHGIYVTFSEVMDNNSTSVIGKLSPANVGMYAYQWDTSVTNSLCRTFIFALPNGLKYDTTYTFTVLGFKDDGGTPMAETSFSFTTEKSSDAALSGLAVSEGTLNPVFDPGTAVYEVNVPNSTTELIVTPTVRGTGAVVTVNGNTVASGSPSDSIPLSPGDNLVDITVTAQDETTTKIYAIWVNRKPDTHAALSSLIISQGTLSPVFGSGIYDYNISVGSNVDSMTVTPAASGAGATVTVNGNAVASGTMSAPIALAPGANLVCISVMAQDGITEEDYTLHVTRAQPSATFTVTAAAGSGGSISPSGTVSVIKSNNQSFTITPGSGHRISSVTVDGVDQGAITTYIFTNVTANHTINATFTSLGGGNSTPTTSTHNADVTEDSGAISTLPVTVDKGSGSASVTIDSRGAGLSNGENLTVTLPSIPGVSSYSLSVPVAYLTTPGGGSLTFNTDTGSITLPADMLAGISGAEGKKAEITIGRGDKSGLPDSVKAAIGDRPLIQLYLALDGKQTEWNNPDSPVIISIPYTPAAAELDNPESIVIWYIDGSGNIVCIPNGHYHPATGTVTFSITHFSLYAVGYNTVSFNDVAAGAWYNDAVSFIAAREITSGTGNGNYSPEAKLTRGEFIVLMMRGYGIAPDANSTDNFADAGNTYYTGYLAAAKRLGISAGVGNNMYAPGKEITRQEMFTLLYNALKVIGQLPKGDSGKTLSDFTDAGQIDTWAKDAMTLLVKTGTVGGSGGKLTPLSTTTRAEMAQLLYNLLGE